MSPHGVGNNYYIHPAKIKIPISLTFYHHHFQYAVDLHNGGKWQNQVDLVIITE